MSKQLVTAYVALQERIKEQRKILAAMKEEEKRIQRELTDCINQTEDGGIRIDECTVLVVEQKDKKVNRSKKAYREYLARLCYDRGLPEEEMVTEIINGKVETTVQQPKLKIIKNK